RAQIGVLQLRDRRRRQCGAPNLKLQPRGCARGAPYDQVELLWRAAAVAVADQLERRWAQPVDRLGQHIVLLVDQEYVQVGCDAEPWLGPLKVEHDQAGGRQGHADAWIHAIAWVEVVAVEPWDDGVAAGIFERRAGGWAVGRRLIRADRPPGRIGHVDVAARCHIDRAILDDIANRDV